MEKTTCNISGIITKILCFIIISIFCASFLSGCGNNKNQAKQPSHTASSTPAAASKDGMILFDDAEYEFYYPKEWADMVKTADNGIINLYRDESSNYVSFAVGKMEYGSINEAVSQYKSAAVSFEQVKTNTGEDMYLAENSVSKGINFTAYVFNNNKQYELRASMTYDFYNKNIELIKKIANTIHIKNYSNNNISSGYKSSEGSQDQGSLKSELQGLEQKNLGTKNFIKTGEIEDKLLLESGGEITFDIDTLYTATYSLLTGLTSGNKDLLKQCLYNPENELSELTGHVAEFSNNGVASHSRDFKIYVVDKDKVYIDLQSSSDDMQFNIKFNKVAGKYYFDSLIQK